MSRKWTGLTLIFGVLAAATVAAGERPAAAGDGAEGASVEVIVRRVIEPGAAPDFDVVEVELAELGGLVFGVSDIAGIELHGSARIAWEPTEADYAQQWTHRLTGLEHAWEVTRGDREVVIAVLDTGVTPHPDLGDRLLPGASFVEGDPWVDPNGHGTNVAVIAGAAHDGFGIAGVCPECSILPVQVADGQGMIPWGAAAEGIVWAVDQGADILNLSFGGASQPEVVEQAIEYALANEVIVIAAAGNDGSDAAFYPAASPGVISVGAHDDGFARYPWSNFGPGVDVAAPGCALGAGGAEAGQVCGTSYAAPWAAGVAALMAAFDGELTPSMVEQGLENSTTPLTWVETGWVDGARVFAAAEPAFADVSDGVFYADAVGWLVAEGITTGTAPGVFSPDASVTRGQLATFLWRMQGMPDASASAFADVSDGVFYADAVGWLVAEGITTGTAPGVFSPDASVTRGQLATFLWRMQGMPDASASAFADVSDGVFYADAVGWLVAEGITTGTAPGVFSPDASVTRGQLATFLWRLQGSPQA